MKIDFKYIFRAVKIAFIGLLSWKLWDRFRTAKKDAENDQNHP